MPCIFAHGAKGGSCPVSGATSDGASVGGCPVSSTGGLDLDVFVWGREDPVSIKNVPKEVDAAVLVSLVMSSSPRLRVQAGQLDMPGGKSGGAPGGGKTGDAEAGTCVDPDEEDEDLADLVARNLVLRRARTNLPVAWDLTMDDMEVESGEEFYLYQRAITVNVALVNDTGESLMSRQPEPIQLVGISPMLTVDDFIDLCLLTYGDAWGITNHRAALTLETARLARSDAPDGGSTSTTTTDSTPTTDGRITEVTDADTDGAGEGEQDEDAVPGDPREGRPFTVMTWPSDAYLFQMGVYHGQTLYLCLEVDQFGFDRDSCMSRVLNKVDYALEHHMLLVLSVLVVIVSVSASLLLPRRWLISAALMQDLRNDIPDIPDYRNWDPTHH